MLTSEIHNGVRRFTPSFLSSLEDVSGKVFEAEVTTALIQAGFCVAGSDLTLMGKVNVTIIGFNIQVWNGKSIYLITNLSDLFPKVRDSWLEA